MQSPLFYSPETVFTNSVQGLSQLALPLVVLQAQTASCGLALPRRRQRCPKSGASLRSYLNRMNGSPHFVVYVHIECFGDLQRYGERVRDLGLQGSSTRPATHLNLQILVLDIHARSFASEDLVLQGSSLNCPPVRLLPTHSKRLLRRVEPEIRPPPSLMSLVDRRQPRKRDGQPSMTAPATQRRRQWKTVNVRLILFEPASAESGHTPSGAFFHPVEVHRAVTEQPRDVFLELPAVVFVLQYSSQYRARFPPLCSMCDQRLEPDRAREAIYDLSSGLLTKLVHDVVEQSAGAADQRGRIARAPGMPHGSLVAGCCAWGGRQLSGRKRSVVDFESRSPCQCSPHDSPPTGCQHVGLDPAAIPHALCVDWAGKTRSGIRIVPSGWWLPCRCILVDRRHGEHIHCLRRREETAIPRVGSD